jgi:KDO2-lipid IV(A) lauroyltransferase
MGMRCGLFPAEAGLLLVQIPEPLDDAETTAAWMNKVVEKCIMMAPEQYMWLHRRFKTRPEGVPSRY